jgi:hypothetical protein
MLTKLLLTGAVFVFMMFLQRMRTRRSQEIPTVRVVPERKTPSAMPPWLKPAAYGFAAFTVLASCVWYYSAWHEDQSIVTIRVINPSSGDVSTYRARKGAIDGRRFQTVEGLTVRIADAERVELFESGE